MPLPALLATGALVLTVVTYGLTASTAVDIETRRRAADEAVQLIHTTIKEVESDLGAARGSNDVVETVRLERLLADLNAVRRGTNPLAAQRQAEQLYQSFAGTESRKTVLGQMAGQLPGGGFSIMEMWDLMTALTQKEDTKEHPSELLDRLKGQIKKAQTRGALPDNLPDYIAQSTMRDVLAENPQVGEVPGPERRRFMCEQARKRIDKLIGGEADPTRGEILELARDSACRVTARGELGIPSEAKKFVASIGKNELCMSYEIGGAAGGHVELDVTLKPEVLAMAQKLGESIGTAVAGAVTLGVAGDNKGKKSKQEKCTGGIRVDAALEGTQEGDRASGTVNVSKQSGLTLRCGTEKKQIELGDKDLGLTWSATEGEASVKLVLGKGRDALTTDLPISTKPPNRCARSGEARPDG